MQKKSLVKYKASLMGPKWGNRLITRKKGYVFVTYHLPVEIQGKVQDWIIKNSGPNFTLIAVTIDVIPEI